MDYDNLVKERRRNWDALKPDEVRRREKDEEKERRREEAEKSGKGFRHDRRVKQLAAAAERDATEYRRVMRQVGLLGGIFLAVIVVSMGLSALWKYRQELAWKTRIETTSRAVADGQRINDLSDPIGAMATWRSAWSDKDMRKMVSLFSRRLIEKVSKDRNLQRIVEEHMRLLERGALDRERDIAMLFHEPEIVHLPSPPWSREELAIFRTDHVQFLGEDGPGHRYIASFSWDPDNKRWRFADVREEQYFSVKWRSEAAIQIAKGGPRAQKFDAEGNRLP